MPGEPSAGRTRRQELADALSGREWTFDGLRHAFQCGVRELEDDLRHVERSARRGPRRLRVTPARCEACGFVFRNREPRHFHPPSRCPECKAERVLPARLRIDAAGEG
jgi:predicted Zn-ribbon and HTH transcriptional regulator